MPLYLSEENKKILFSILQKYKNDYVFFAFGSRVKGTQKKYSDLDIAVVDKNKTGLTKIKNELEESHLSITIDLVDIDQMSEDFRSLIDQEKIPLFS